jgi:hypothetical protein
VRPVRSLPARLTVALGLAAGAVLAAPAGAEATCFTRVQDGPQFCTQAVWFSPSGTDKAGNLAAVGAGEYPTWTTDEPTQSVAAGAGGGYATMGAQRQLNGVSDPATGGLFKGSFTGDLDNLAVTMYLFSPGRDSAAGWYGGVDVVVDGTTVHTADADGIPLSSGGNAVQKIDFTVDKLHAAITKAGLATGPDVVHEVELFVTSYALAGTTAVLVYGTTEAPSSMTFNVDDLTGRFKL